ncbi:MAG TPA: hypothetical protein VFE47_24075 [Tepidisphaeraceae bacterium]|jgi:hypothetical protein|nr:hypothetical protein [Tepidisphaeraceae bacterium]
MFRNRDLIVLFLVATSFFQGCTSRKNVDIAPLPMSAVVSQLSSDPREIRICPEAASIISSAAATPDGRLLAKTVSSVGTLVDRFVLFETIAVRGGHASSSQPFADVAAENSSGAGISSARVAIVQFAIIFEDADGLGFITNIAPPTYRSGLYTSPSYRGVISGYWSRSIADRSGEREDLDRATAQLRIVSATNADPVVRVVYDSNSLDGTVLTRVVKYDANGPRTRIAFNYANHGDEKNLDLLNGDFAKLWPLVYAGPKDMRINDRH